MSQILPQTGERTCDQTFWPSPFPPMTQSHLSLDQVTPPASVERLRELAYNLWWSWHEEAQELFRRINPHLWERTGHNPVAFLRRVGADRLEAAVADVGYMTDYRKVFRAFDSYIGETDPWFAIAHPAHRSDTIAYFSTEFV